MAKNIFQNYNFAGNQIIDFRTENLGANPTAGKAGRVFFNTSTSMLAIDTGLVIRPLLTELDWADLTGKPSTFTPAAHTHPQSEVTGLVSALEALAPLASPAFTGNPTASTQTAGNSSTRIATTAFVSAAVSAAGSGTAGLGALATLDTVGTPEIDNRAVTPSKLAAVATATIRGRASAGTGSVQNLSASHVKTILAIAQTDVSGLVAALAGKSDTGHTHTASNISDFNTAVNTQVAAYWDAVAGGDNNADTIRETLDIVLANASAVAEQIGRYNADIGDGVATAIAVTHSLNSLDVSVEVYDRASGDSVGVGVTRTNNNVVTIEAIPAPTANALRVVIKK